MTQSAEIPFWIYDKPKWVSGITRQTTCQDILHSLVKAERQAAGKNLGRADGNNKASYRDRNGSVTKRSSTNSLPRSSSKSKAIEGSKDYNSERREDITCRKVSRQLALVEQWRGVERPLSGTSRILKLWNAWGEEKGQVRFAIKRISSSSSSSLTTSGVPVVKPIQDIGNGTSTTRSNGPFKRPAPPPPPTLASLITTIDRSASTASSLSKGRKPRRRNSRASASSRNGQGISNPGSVGTRGKTTSGNETSGAKTIRYNEDTFKRSETVHPNALLKKRVAAAYACGTDKLTNSEAVLHQDIERLMRIILTQGETIHAQLKRLREREGQIENIEQQVHDSRTKTAGKDYLLNAYLKDGEQNTSANDEDIDPYLKGDRHEDEMEVRNQRKQGNDKSEIRNNRIIYPRTSSPDGATTHFKSLPEMLDGLNQVLNINDRIVNAEEHINDLQYQLTIAGSAGRCQEGNKESREIMLEQEEETSSTRSELVELKTLNDKFGREIEANRQLIRSMKTAFNERRALVAQLEEDVSSVESEGHQLRAELASIQESRQRQTLEFLSKHNSENNIDEDSEIGGEDYESEDDEEDIPILFADAAFLKNEDQHRDGAGVKTSHTPSPQHPPPTSMLLRNGHFQISNEQLYDSNHLPSHNPISTHSRLPLVNNSQSLKQHDPRSLYDELQRRLHIKTAVLQDNCDEPQTLQPPSKPSLPGNHSNTMGVIMLDPNITNRITATGSPGSASSSGNSSGSGGSYGSNGDSKNVRFSDRDMIIATPELPDQLEDGLPLSLSTSKSQQYGLQTYHKYQDKLVRDVSASNAIPLSEITKDNTRKVLSRSSGNLGSNKGLQTTPSTNGGANDTNSKSKSVDNVGDTDSNSDTGLSSLHSSSDEGTYVLDTLV